MKPPAPPAAETATGPLTPPMSLLVKLGSIAVHVDELLSARGHTYDRVAIQSLLDDTEVQLWLRVMNEMAMLPVKR
jgi:hypothetical protein